MSHATRAPRATLWRRRAALATIPAMLLALLTTVVSSQAVVDSPFDIDGDVPDSTATQFEDPNLGTAELGPKNGSSTKLGVIHSAAKPMLSLTNPNGQVDLDNIWLETTTDEVTGDSWLYFAFQRDSASGSGVVMYEFQFADAPTACDYSSTSALLIANCNPFENRAPGDFVLVFDQQGTEVDIYIRYFRDGTPAPGWNKGDKLILEATLTDLTENDLAEATMSLDGFYGEAAVNLSETIFAGDPQNCLTVGNIVPGTVTGNSDTADYKDTVLQDFTDAVSISNCGSVKIIKDTNPDDLEGTFPYTLSRSGGETIRFPADGGGTSATGTLTEDDDFEMEEDLIAAGNYTLSEGDVGPEFGLIDITCVTGTGDDAVTVNVYPDGNDFAVASGALTTCTITNEQLRGDLVVQKVLINDNGGTADYDDFSWSLDGAAGTAFADGDPVTTSVLVGTYDITEPEANTMGYTTTYEGCEDMVVTAGGTATCTITNDDQPGTLKVQKVLINDNGGSADYGDFSWSLDGAAGTAFADGNVVETTVDAGTYNVTEPEEGTMGYTTSYEGCADMVIANGGEATCVITNDDDPGTLKVQKVLINDNGGSADYGDFSWSLDGAAGTAFADGNVVETTVDAGTYNVTEPEANEMGYTTSYEGCADMVIANGGTATCTITNDDDPGTLKVQKVLINDNGGSADYGDFSWSLDGAAGTAFADGNVVETTVDAGTYNVTEPEANEMGYTTSYEGCADMVIPNGGEATCVITNDDQQGNLLVRKVLIIDNGGTADYGDFSWSVDGDATSTPFVDDQTVSTPMDAGSYDVTEPEANSMGYTTSYEGCEDVVVPNGGNSAECVITNDDTKADPNGITVQHWVLHDAFALTGLRVGAPDAGAATATFSVYSDASCETQVGSDEAVGVEAGAAATVDGVTVYETGTYYWLVEYSGDQYNNGFTTGCGDEITQIAAKDAKDGGRNNIAV